MKRLAPILLAILTVLFSATAVFADVIAEPETAVSIFARYWPYFLGFAVFVVVVMVVQHINNKRDGQ